MTDIGMSCYNQPVTSALWQGYALLRQGMWKMARSDNTMNREAYIRGAREFLARKRNTLQEKNRELWNRANNDAGAIIDMIVRDYNPAKIYQWGSVLHPDEFRDYSDIDIAIEGLTEVATIAEMEGKACRMTAFPLDLVVLEKVHPRHADTIRKKGRLVYERP